jgi:hypothetical protein
MAANSHFVSTYVRTAGVNENPLTVRKCNGLDSSYLSTLRLKLRSYASSCGLIYDDPPIHRLNMLPNLVPSALCLLPYPYPPSESY